MYITITPQKLGELFSQSVANYVDYLEKENIGIESNEMEHFFNQYEDEICAKDVSKGIDKNTSKLKKKEPKFYAITVSPSKYELSQLQNSNADLKAYTRALMKDYVNSFNREINGKPITIDDIKYYAKVEHQRRFKGTDKQVKENQIFATKILALKKDIREAISLGEKNKIKKIQKEIDKLEKTAPHQLNGKRIVQGMLKEGSQSHIHIIVSRKDASNSVSLSPGSKYKAANTVMNGKIVKRGFDRDLFFENAEKRFDQQFKYKRNYAETYQARKVFLKNQHLYFSTILGLPSDEKAIAFKILGNMGVPGINIPATKVKLALKVIKQLKRGVELGINSSSIGI